MLTKLKQFFKSHIADIFIFLVVFLLCLLSFGAGIAVNRFYFQKTPLKIEVPK